MKLTRLILLIFFNALIGNAQDSLSPHKFLLSCSPGHLMEFFHGTSANFGAEFSLNEHYSFYGEVGKYLPNSLVANNYYQSGTTFAGELKYYFNPAKYTAKFYASVQYLQGRQKYTRADPTDDVDDGTSYAVYKVDKAFYDFSTRFGVLFVNQKRLVLNPYIGVGIRSQTIKGGLTNDQKGIVNLGSQWSPHKWIHDSGRSTYAKVQLGIRIGIKIL